MSQGILHAARGMGSLFSNLEIRGLSLRDKSSDEPTLADLILPGTGNSFSDEFACLLRLLCAKGEPE